MRCVVLYARGRGIPLAVLVVALVSVTAAGAAGWLVARPEFDGMARLPVAVAAALASAVVLTGSLHSAVGEIEAATRTPWLRWRAAHAAGAALVAAVFLAPALPAATYGSGVLLRDAAGMLGLSLLTAVCTGPRLAWTLPVGYVFSVYLAAGSGDTALRPAWAFFVEPAESRTALITASVLFVSGILAWALVGAGASGCTVGRMRRSVTRS